MQVRRLRYFVAVAEEGNFSRAAERLWVTQPSLSTQIRRLEVEVGVELFERHNRGVSLTAGGVMLLERARVALDAMVAVEELGHDLAEGRRGSLRIGICRCAAWSGAPRLLERLAAEHPGIETTVVESFGGMLVRDVRDHRLDAALVSAPFATPELAAAPLGADPLVVAVGGGHRLDAEGPLTGAELAGETLLVFGHRDARAFDRATAVLLAGLGASLQTRRGAPGPGFLEPVAAGEALAVTTVAGALRPGVRLRPLQPARALPFVIVHPEAEASAAFATFLAAAAASRSEPDRDDSNLGLIDAGEDSGRGWIRSPDLSVIVGAAAREVG